MKRNKISTFSRFKHKQFNPNAPKNNYTYWRERRLKQNEDRDEYESLNETSKTNLTFIETPEFDHVSVESIDILNSMIKDNKDDNSTDDTVELFNVNAKSAKKKRQRDIDNQILDTFYKNQNAENFTRVWQRFYPGISKYTLKMMGDIERANDMCQETFQRAWEKRAEYDPNKSLYVTWLYIICRNLCITRLKLDSMTKTIDMDVNDMFDSKLYQDMIEIKTDDVNIYYILDENNQISSQPYDMVMKKMFDAAVAEIKKMDPLFQKIIQMKEMNDMTLAEIAESLNISESKVKNIYYKSRNCLTKNIIDNNQDLFYEYQNALADHDETQESAIYRNLNYKNTDTYIEEYNFNSYC